MKFVLEMKDMVGVISLGRRMMRSVRGVSLSRMRFGKFLNVNLCVMSCFVMLFCAKEERKETIPKEEIPEVIQEMPTPITPEVKLFLFLLVTDDSYFCERLGTEPPEEVKLYMNIEDVGIVDICATYEHYEHEKKKMNISLKMNDKLVLEAQTIEDFYCKRFTVYPQEAPDFFVPGTYKFVGKVTVEPNGTEDEKMATLVINEAGPIIISEKYEEKVKVGENYNYEIQVIDSDGEGSIRLNLETDCEWLTLEGNILKGRAEKKGECSVTIIAEDNEGEKIQQCFTVKVLQ